MKGCVAICAFGNIVIVFLLNQILYMGGIFVTTKDFLLGWIIVCMGPLNPAQSNIESYLFNNQKSILISMCTFLG